MVVENSFGGNLTMAKNWELSAASSESSSYYSSLAPASGSASSMDEDKQVTGLKHCSTTTKTALPTTNPPRKQSNLSKKTIPTFFVIPNNRADRSSHTFLPSKLQQQARLQQAQKTLHNLKQYILETPFPLNNHQQQHPQSRSFWGNSNNNNKSSSTNSSACSSLSSSMETLNSPHFGNGTQTSSQTAIIQEESTAEEEEAEEDQKVKEDDWRGSVVTTTMYTSPMTAPAESSTSSSLSSSPASTPNSDSDIGKTSCSSSSVSATDLILNQGITEPDDQGITTIISYNSKPSSGLINNNKKNNRDQQQPNGAGDGGLFKKRGCGSANVRMFNRLSSSALKNIMSFEDIIQEEGDEEEEEDESAAEAELSSSDDSNYFSDSSSSDQNINTSCPTTRGRRRNDNPHVLDPDSLTSTLTRRYSTGDLISALLATKATSNCNSQSNNYRRGSHSIHYLTNQHRGFPGTAVLHGRGGLQSSKLPKRKLSHHKSLELVLNLLPTIPEQQSPAIVVSPSGAGVKEKTSFEFSE